MQPIKLKIPIRFTDWDKREVNFLQMTMHMPDLPKGVVFCTNEHYPGAILIYATDSASRGFRLPWRSQRPSLAEDILPLLGKTEEEQRAQYFLLAATGELPEVCATEVVIKLVGVRKHTAQFRFQFQDQFGGWLNDHRTGTPIHIDEQSLRTGLFTNDQLRYLGETLSRDWNDLFVLGMSAPVREAPPPKHPSFDNIWLDEMVDPTKKITIRRPNA